MSPTRKALPSESTAPQWTRAAHRTFNYQTVHIYSDKNISPSETDRIQLLYSEKNGQFNSNPFVSTLKIKEQANGEGKSWKLIIGKLSKPSVYKVPRYKKAYTCIGFFILKSAEKAYNTCSEQVDGETSRKCSKVSHRDISHCRV